MITVDLRNKSVLVTGGTRGLGKRIGFEFARAGATVYLTHRWGSADENEIKAEFRSAGLAAPRIIEADASDVDDTRHLMATIKKESGGVYVVVSNVAFSKVINELGDLKRNALDLSLSYSAWPLVELIQVVHEVTERFPCYVLAISSDGPEVCHDGYDLAGVSKAVLETLCRYLALRLKQHNVRINAIRPGFLDTASARATFGDDVIGTVQERTSDMFIDPQGVAQVCLALCSGLMDSITGQVIVVDEGWSLVSPVAHITGRGLPGNFPGDKAEVWDDR